MWCKDFYKTISKKFQLFFRKFFFATSLKFERFLAPRSRFFEKVNAGEIITHHQAMEVYIMACYEATISSSREKSAAKNYLCILIASIESWPETTDFGFISISKPFFNSTECLHTLTASSYFVLGKSKNHRILNERLHM
ncbi:hypothetical protein LXL04_004028 [Taraxacum kok-saghyz]